MSSPDFESKIPEHLLQSETPAMRYLMTELSKNTQATEYLLQKREESGEKLDEISKKLDYTNGKIAKNILDVAELQLKAKKQEELQEDVEDIVKVKRFAQKYLFNKYAVIGFVALFIGLFKIISSPELRELAFKLLGF